MTYFTSVMCLQASSGFGHSPVKILKYWKGKTTSLIFQGCSTCECGEWNRHTRQVHSMFYPCNQKFHTKLAISSGSQKSSECLKIASLKPFFFCTKMNVTCMSPFQIHFFSDIIFQIQGEQTNSVFKMATLSHFMKKILSFLFNFSHAFFRKERTAHISEVLIAWTRNACFLCHNADRVDKAL